MPDLWRLKARNGLHRQNSSNFGELFPRFAQTMAALHFIDVAVLAVHRQDINLSHPALFLRVERNISQNKRIARRKNAAQLVHVPIVFGEGSYG